MYPNMEKKLFKHLMKKRNVGALISRQYVQAKARKIAQRQCLEKFCGNFFEFFVRCICLFVLIKFQYILNALKAQLVGVLIF